MKRGDIVRHKLADEIYRILKTDGVVAVCQCPPHSQKFGWYWREWDRYICQVENLEPHPQSQFIFDWIDSFGANVFHGTTPDNKITTMEIYERQQLPKPGTQLTLI